MDDHLGVFLFCILFVETFLLLKILRKIIIIKKNIIQYKDFFFSKVYTEDEKLEKILKNSLNTFKNSFIILIYFLLIFITFIFLDYFFSIKEIVFSSIGFIETIIISISYIFFRKKFYGI